MLFFRIIVRISAGQRRRREVAVGRAKRGLPRVVGGMIELGGRTRAARGLDTRSVRASGSGGVEGEILREAKLGQPTLKRSSVDPEQRRTMCLRQR